LDISAICSIEHSGDWLLNEIIGALGDRQHVDLVAQEEES
jgi:hypothetical protein